MRKSLVLLGLVLFVAACGGGEPPPRPEPLPATPDGNFVLYVSNQSFELPEVDIRVEIDGRLAVDDEFHVEGQHNWVEFRFRLPNGPHTLKAVSRTGKAEASWKFRVTGKHWAVVDYWYYPGESKSFSFGVSDEPIGFA